MTTISDLYCKQPDRDVPGITCGHPLPCPYHTNVIENGKVKGPDEADPRLNEIAEAFAGTLTEEAAFLPMAYQQDLLDHLSRLRKHLKSKLDEKQLRLAWEFLRDELITELGEMPVIKPPTFEVIDGGKAPTFGSDEDGNPVPDPPLKAEFVDLTGGKNDEE